MHALLDKTGSHGHGAGGGSSRRGGDQSDPYQEADEVRAPIASKVDRLYGGGGHGGDDPRYMAAASAGNHGFSRKAEAPASHCQGGR